MVARSTPDRKVASSNLTGLIQSGIVLPYGMNFFTFDIFLEVPLIRSDVILTYLSKHFSRAKFMELLIVAVARQLNTEYRFPAEWYDRLRS